MQCIIIYLLLCWWCYILRPVSDVILVTMKHTIASRPHLACLSQGWNFCSEGTLRFPTTLYWGHKSFSFSGVTSERRINSNLLQVFLLLFWELLTLNEFGYAQSPQAENGSRAICHKMSHFGPKSSSVCKTHSAVLGQKTISCIIFP